MASNDSIPLIGAFQNLHAERCPRMPRLVLERHFSSLSQPFPAPAARLLLAHPIISCSCGRAARVTPRLRISVEPCFCLAELHLTLRYLLRRFSLARQGKRPFSSPDRQDILATFDWSLPELQSDNNNRRNPRPFCYLPYQQNLASVLSL
jgi:hypothetical protein